MTDAASSNLDGFRKLQKEYATTIPQKLQELKDLIHTLHLKEAKNTVATLKMSVHKIAGNAGAFGYGQASAVGSSFEEFLMEALEKNRLDQKMLAEQCTSYVKKLEEAFEQHP